MMRLHPASPVGESLRAGVNALLARPEMMPRLSRMVRWCRSGTMVAKRADSICRTAGYVTRMSGGVGGRGREASSYPDSAPGDPRERRPALVGRVWVRRVSRSRFTRFIELRISAEHAPILAAGQRKRKH